MPTFTMLKNIRRVISFIFEMTGRIKTPYLVILTCLVVAFDVALIILVVRLIEYDIHVLTP